MRYLKNLSSQALHEGSNPWDFKPAEPAPEEVRKDKHARTEWISCPSTDWQVYTFNEGVINSQRISKLKKDEEGNPIHSTSALVADYDDNEDEAVVLRRAAKLQFQPNWIERTLSGNWRFVWLLEEKLMWASFEHAVHFFKEFQTFGFDVKRVMAGLDEKAWCAPEKLWTNSGDWRPLSNKKIPASVSTGWVMKSLQTFNKSDLGPTIPLEEVKAEFIKHAEKYPRFAEWPGEFKQDAQGPTFWVAASESPKSAIVGEAGMFTFANHACRAFYPWVWFFGIDFVKAYQADAAGKATKDIYFDGQLYWRKLPNGKWVAEVKTNLMSTMKTTLGVSSKIDKTGSSDLDRAENFIRDHKRVDAVGPFIFKPEGHFVSNYGVESLNISRTKVMQPAKGVAIWGPDGQLPWCSGFFDTTFVPVDEGPLHQRDVLIAWLTWFFKGAFAGNPLNGHSLFIAGPPDIGKSLLSRYIIAPLFGDFVDAGEALLGDSSFNSELFNKGIWCIDDGAANADQARHRKWSAVVKRVSANAEWSSHEKFKTPCKVTWNGRLIVTLNADEESVQLIPDLSASLMDKIILLRTVDKQALVFPPHAELKTILDRELPWLARFILDHKIPAHLLGKTRFGIKEYAEPRLAASVHHSSRAAVFNEILVAFTTEFFNVTNCDAKFWEGTAFQLDAALRVANTTSLGSLKDLTPNLVGRHLSALKNRGDETLSNREVHGLRKWKIARSRSLT